MKILLDTNILLWMYLKHQRYESRLDKIFKEADEVYYSVVSIWEIAIKRSGKGFQDLDIPNNWYDSLINQAELSGIKCLDIKLEPCQRIETLPLHHRDPFDRMIIAQAMENNLAVMTSDKMFSEYDVQVIN